MKFYISGNVLKRNTFLNIIYQKLHF